jgi:hypothetical protein
MAENTGWEIGGMAGYAYGEAIFLVCLSETGFVV